MRLFRVCTSEIPTDWDLQSHEARGKGLPRLASPATVRDWPRVSTYTTLPMARDKARAANLGDWIAELEVPAEVEKHSGAVKLLGRHVSLAGTTPAQLRGYIVAITSVTAR